MNVKDLIQVGRLTGDGWLFELYTVSNISGLYSSVSLSLGSAQAPCINCAYHIWHLLLYLPTTSFSLLFLISDEEVGLKETHSEVLEW